MAEDQQPQTEKPQEQVNGDNKGHNDNNQKNEGSEGNEENQNGHTGGKVATAKEKLTAKEQKLRDKQNPPGGYDRTPIPPAPDGYTIKITFHRAENLPVSDVSSRSSDPYLTATLTAALQKRHKEDPDMVLRTPTIHKSTDPEWNTEWIVAGVPSSGFRLKCRLYDEDYANQDDRLGNVTIYVNHIDENWQGIKENSFDIKKRMASKRAYLLRGCVVMLNSNIKMSGSLIVSVEVLGPSEEPYGRMYTIGKTFYFKHYSPMIGRLTGTKAPESEEREKANEAKSQNEKGKGGKAEENGNDKAKAEKYDFQANQLQLQGPIPQELYHRFVEFKPFVKGMFSKAGLRGRVLNRALHHQHARVYNFSSTTEYGIVKPKSEEVALQFLKMVHFDEGGRIFTYVLTLDGLLRFTETGKEFGIDLLSKHTMHSDVNIYVACAGEFFIRRLKKPHKPVDAPDQATHPEQDIPGGPPNKPPPESPKNYELNIDNDSGTYRPDASILPKLKEFLNENFPGLHVVVKTCDNKELEKMKEEQRERKKKEGSTIEMIQNSDDEISSSDEEALEGLSAQGKRKKRVTKQRAYDALEHPSKAVKDVFLGKGKENEATVAKA